MLCFSFYGFFFNNFEKPSIIIGICYKKQTNRPYKQYSNRQDVFTENFTIFFSNAGKTENVPEFKLERF